MTTDISDPKQTGRSRLIVPGVLAILLILLHELLQLGPVEIGGLGDVRELIFGKDLRVLQFAALLAATVVIVRILDIVLFDVVFSKKRQIIAPVLLREIVGVGLYAFFIASTISWVYGRNVTGLLTSATVIAAILGLALQETLGNLVAGISLHLERTFEPGDFIRIGDSTGCVERTNWRATQIRTLNDNIVVVPNSVIARGEVEIFPRSGLNARVVTVGLSYNLPPERAIAVLEQAVVNVPHVSRENPALARVSAFADSSITYEIKYWTRDYHLHRVIDADIRRAVWYALRRNGMSIPFPIRTLHRYDDKPTERMPGIEETLQRIESVDILAPLPSEGRRQIAESTRLVTWGRNETILRAGQEGSSMFILHSGEVSVRTSDRSETVELAQLGPGSFFGEMALLTGQSRNADVIALTEVVAFEIAKESLHPVLVGNPELAAALSRRVMERRDLVETQLQGEELSQQGVLRRIRSWFRL